jgi:hypothetical protein
MSRLEAVVKRTLQPTIQDYRTSAEILQGAIKRRQTQPIYQKYQQASRKNISIDELKELSKPYLLTTLRQAWRNDLYKLTIYAKPLNKLNKAELYHELLNANHDFSKLPKKPPPKKRR